jgi:hypothetical protein
LPGLLRAGTAVLLIAGIAAAADARGALAHRPLHAAAALVDAARRATVPFAVAAFAVAAVALAAVLQRRRREDAAGRLPARRMTRREKALTAIALLLALASIMTLRILRRPPRSRSGSRPSPTRPSHGSATAGPWHLGVGSGAVLAVVLIAVVTGVLLLRARRSRAAPVRDDPRQAVKDAAAGGRRALLADPDPRRAIVAAYLALEDAMRDSGLRLAPSRTPNEVLQTAAAEGQVDPIAATVLVRLFERARFSTQPLTAADRDRALIALDALVGGARPC